MKFTGTGWRGTAEVHVPDDLTLIVDAARETVYSAGEQRQWGNLALVPNKRVKRDDAKCIDHHLASVVNANGKGRRVARRDAEIDGATTVPQDRGLHDVAEIVDVVGNPKDQLVVVEAEGESTRPTAEQRQGLEYSVFPGEPDGC